MQVVIDIPNEYRELFKKEKCKEKFDSLCTNEFGYVLRKAFENGIVLPNGHGDLIDRSKIAFDYWSIDNYVCVGKRNIFEMPVIVPAEKE